MFVLAFKYSYSYFHLVPVLYTQTHVYIIRTGTSANQNELSITIECTIVIKIDSIPFIVCRGIFLPHVIPNGKIRIWGTEDVTGEGSGGSDSPLLSSLSTLMILLISEDVLMELLHVISWWSKSIMVLSEASRLMTGALTRSGIEGSVDSGNKFISGRALSREQ